ncbi:MAG: UvrD-helicase domain-containing protein, partial [Bifidobacteriaceae bacterium]|nr:UvrD-helicase domain-containing protein [Bifidobacteriaceae bacterium]
MANASSAGFQPALIDLTRLPSLQRGEEPPPDDEYGAGSRGGPGGWAPADPDALLDGLNAEQKAAVTHQGGPLLIVAGAGSGKTRVLVHRIAYLLATGRARPGEILAITFTNKAAAEMRERVQALVGPAARHMWVSTFHSACVRILRREAKTMGLKQSFSIYDQADSVRLVQMAANAEGLDPKKHPPKALANRISALKNELVDPEDFSKTVSREDSADGILCRVYRDYAARLRAANAMDFDDLIMNTVSLLQAFPAVGEHYRRRFRHVFVDEYQDTNHAQYVLVSELAGVAADSQVGAGIPPAEITVVGDADQSIYAFRGATIRNIVEFETDYPDASTILLEQNYRSTQNILTAANAVIAKNPGRRPKSLWTAAGAGPKVIGYVADSEHDEARFIAGEIDRLGHAEGIRPRDIAVFYRTNAQSRVLEEQLIRVGLPYRVVGGTRFYDRREIRDAIAYLRAIDNPDDTVSARRIFNVPRRGLGERSEAAVAVAAERAGISFGAALRREIPGVSARAAKAIAGLAQLLDSLTQEAAAGAGPAHVLDEVLARSGYVAELEQSDDPQDTGRRENLAELHAVAKEFERREPDGTLSDFLERVSLVADSDQIPVDDAGAPDGAARADGGMVTLMTLHTAKGLEFPAVFLTGLEDGTLPHVRALADTAELEEERRLAYVGFTRAQQRLYLSRAAGRTTWGRPESFPASRFLSDIPAEILDWRREKASVEALRAGGGAEWGSGPVRRKPARDATGAGAGATPSFGSAKPRAAKDIPALAVGDRVTHDVY